VCAAHTPTYNPIPLIQGVFSVDSRLFIEKWIRGKE
jgi:hypothetical protein